MSSVMDAQEEGKFDEMETRDKEIQAAVWSLIFLVSEISLAFRVLRDVLTERGALNAEDEQLINDMASNDARMQAAYEHIEKAFRNKYSRVMEAMMNPEGVTQAVQGNAQHPSSVVGQTIDFNDPENWPTVTGTDGT